MSVELNKLLPEGIYVFLIQMSFFCRAPVRFVLFPSLLFSNFPSRILFHVHFQFIFVFSSRASTGLHVFQCVFVLSLGIYCCLAFSLSLSPTLLQCRVSLCAHNVNGQQSCNFSVVLCPIMTFNVLLLLFVDYSFVLFRFPIDGSKSI